MRSRGNGRETACDLIDSSGHLALRAATSRSEVEHRLVRILNTMRDGNRPRPLAEMSQALDIADTRGANYTLGTLTAAGSITAGPTGTEKTVQIDDPGLAVLTSYLGNCEQLQVQVPRLPQDALSDVAPQLRGVSGYYQQAATG